MLTARQKRNTVNEFQIHESDSGSSEVQVALLTKQILELIGHLKNNPKDHHSRRGLLKIVSKRKKLLDYLSKNSPKSYSALVRKLGLKKKHDL